MKVLLPKLFVVVFAICSIASVNAQTAVELRYELAVNEDPVFVTGDGYAYAVAETFSEMEVNNYSVPHSSAAVWPGDENSYLITKKTQRNKILGGTWPGGDAMMSTRYVQYGITAKESTTLDINKISLYLGVAGSSGLRFMAYYSIDDFSTSTLLIDYSSSVTAYNMYRALAEVTGITLAAGETLKVRVYPWWSGSSDKTSVYLCFAEVNIQGVSSSTLSTKEVLKNTVKWIVGDDLVKIKNAPANSNFTIYDLAGRVVYKSSNSSYGGVAFIKAPVTKGVYIGKVESQEGTQTTKFIVQ